LNHHWVQLGYQLADCVAGFSYAFFGTCIILFIMNLIPGLSLRASDEAEIVGIDDAELGEFAYDFVEVTRETAYVNPEAIEGESKGSAEYASPSEKQDLPTPA
jgi:ammonium transporter, Amt family